MTSFDVPQEAESGHDPQPLNPSAFFDPYASADATRSLASLDAIIVSKETCGFGDRDIRLFSDAIEDAVDRGLKFLVFDFCHQGRTPSQGALNIERFSALIHASANLIVNSSVVSIAWARGHMAGADLEFALSCSMIGATGAATFQFSPHGTAYGFLARKIGMAKAESAMLDGDILSAAAMRDLLLIRHVDVAANSANDGVKEFLYKSSRRHNALLHLYRAQRLVMPVPYELVRAAHRF